MNKDIKMTPMAWDCLGESIILLRNGKIKKPLTLDDYEKRIKNKESEIENSNIDLLGDIVETMGKEKTRLSLLWEGFLSWIKGRNSIK